MAFDWMEPAVSPRQHREEQQGSERVLVRELIDRAGLLRRLGYPLAEAQMRVRGNLLWDFELQGRPPLAARVDEIVASVYARNQKR